MSRKNLYEIRWRRGFKALLDLLKDPDDTAKFGTVVESFQGESALRFEKRFRAHPVGARLMREKPSLLAALSDHRRLEQLPEGTLGRIYLDYCHREGISGAGLKEVLEKGLSQERLAQLTPSQRFIGDWMRDSHDLFHLVTGYQTDLIGELCVLSFTAAQTRNRGVMVPVSMALVMSSLFYPRGRNLAVQAIRRALKAELFPAQDWIALLELPIEEVRRRLKVGDPPVYEPLYTPGRGPSRFEAAASA